MIPKLQTVSTQLPTESSPSKPRTASLEKRQWQKRFYGERNCGCNYTACRKHSWRNNQPEVQQEQGRNHNHQTSVSAMLRRKRNTKAQGFKLGKISRCRTPREERAWNDTACPALFPGKYLGICVGRNPKRGGVLCSTRNEPEPLPQTLRRKKKKKSFEHMRCKVLNFKAKRDCDELFCSLYILLYNILYILLYILFCSLYIEHKAKERHPVISGWTTIYLTKILSLNTSTNSLLPQVSCSDG